jgi:hypothetical protein
MNRFALVLVAAAGGLAATSAAADTGRVAPRAPVAARIAMDGSTVCVDAAASRRCGDYQAALLRTVGQKAAAQRTAISVNDLGRRQLDALIASVN